MDTAMRKRGYFSILRWRHDALRDEAKNVAVVLVDPEGGFGGIRTRALSRVSRDLQKQGLLDSILSSIEHQFDGDEKPNLEYLQTLRGDLSGSLVVTDPRAVIVTDDSETLEALYKAYIRPIGGGTRSITKSKLLDKSVESLRKHGYAVKRSTYFGDFYMDLVVSKPKGTTLYFGETISFANPLKKWEPIEQQAGHFLYALGKLQQPGFAVIAPPSSASEKSATAPFTRVTGWLDGEGVRIFDLDVLKNGGITLD